MSRAALGIAAEGLVFCVAGYALLAGLSLARLRASDVRLVGLAYLTGWAAVGCSLSLALMVGIPSGVPTTVVLGAAIALAGLGVARRRRVALEPVRPPSRHPLGLLAAAAGAAILAVDLVAALVVSVQNVWSTDIDLLTAWLPRASVVHHTHSLDPSAWAAYVTPWYPPLAPVVYGTTYDFVGGFHPGMLPLQQAVTGAAFVLAAFALLDRYAPPWLSLPSLALIASTPWFWWRLAAVLPDQTLAYLLVAAALACVLWLYEGRTGWLGLAAVLLAAATLTKIEGVLFAGVLVALVVAASLLARGRAGRPALVLLLAPAAVLPWQIWLRLNGIATSTPDYNAGGAASPDFLSAHLHRLSFALHYLLRAPWGRYGSERLTATMVVAGIGIWLVTVRRIPAIASVVAAWLALSFAALLAIYWTSRVDIRFYVATSASRVGTTLIVAGAALAPLLLALALRRPPATDAGTKAEAEAR